MTTSHDESKIPPSPLVPGGRLRISDVVALLGFGGWIDGGGNPKYELFRWPPDVFALTATLLRDSGAYLQMARPRDYSKASKESDLPFDLNKWTLKAEETATRWRRGYDKDTDPPLEIQRLLDRIALRASAPGREGELHALSTPDPANFTWLPFLQLMCIADATCRGIGIVFEFPPQGPVKAEDLTYPHDSMVLLTCPHFLYQGL